MREHLTTLGALLRKFLERELPTLGPGWWEQGVLARLSYQQRTAVDEHGWTSLDDLDVAALLRVVDSNWDLFRRRNVVKWDDRNWLKEASSVRNRWAHEAPGRAPSADRVYRDLDTLALLGEALAPSTAESTQLADARAVALAALTSLAEPVRAINPPHLTGLTPGAMVRVKARPDLTGVITHTSGASPQLRLTVFHEQ